MELNTPVLQFRDGNELRYHGNLEGDGTNLSASLAVRSATDQTLLNCIYIFKCGRVESEISCEDISGVEDYLEVGLNTGGMDLDDRLGYSILVGRVRKYINREN